MTWQQSHSPPLYFVSPNTTNRSRSPARCFIPVHTPCSTQWDITIICLMSREAHWHAPRLTAPPPCDDTPQICRVWDSRCTCDSPVHVHAWDNPHLSLTHPPMKSPTQTYAHTHRPPAPLRAKCGLRCKTLPARFNFHLPQHDPRLLVTREASCCCCLLLHRLPRIPVSWNPSHFLQSLFSSTID